MASLNEHDGAIDYEIVEIETPGRERRQEVKEDTEAKRLEYVLRAELKAAREQNASLMLKIERMEKENSRAKRLEDELKSKVERLSLKDEGSKSDAGVGKEKLQQKELGESKPPLKVISDKSRSESVVALPLCSQVNGTNGRSKLMHRAAIYQQEAAKYNLAAHYAQQATNHQEKAARLNADGQYAKESHHLFAVSHYRNAAQHQERAAQHLSRPVHYAEEAFKARSDGRNDDGDKNEETAGVLSDVARWLNNAAFGYKKSVCFKQQAIEGQETDQATEPYSAGHFENNSSHQLAASNYRNATEHEDCAAHHHSRAPHYGEEALKPISDGHAEEFKESVEAHIFSAAAYTSVASFYSREDHEAVVYLQRKAEACEKRAEPISNFLRKDVAEINRQGASDDGIELMQANVGIIVNSNPAKEDGNESGVALPYSC